MPVGGATTVGGWLAGVVATAGGVVAITGGGAVGEITVGDVVTLGAGVELGEAVAVHVEGAGVGEEVLPNKGPHALRRSNRVENKYRKLRDARLEDIME